MRSRQAVAQQPPPPPVEAPGQSQPGETSPSIIAESLVPEATRRSQRRSRREAKREAKQEAKRVAARQKESKRLAKQARKARKKARKSRHRHDVDVVETPAADDDVSVRIIAGPDRAGSQAVGDDPMAPTRSTIAIADDGSPDPVYVEGDLGQDGDAKVLAEAGGDQRSTVFIDDRGPGTGEIVTIDVATSASRMEPRMRERRIAVKRAVGRRRLKWVAIACAAVGLVVAALGVLGSGLFAISTVEVEGAVYSQGASLDAVVDELEGSNVLRVDTSSAERQLEAIPWVADARVTTDFPNGAKIEIRERRPMVAYLATDGRYRVLDSDGRVLDVIAGRPVDYLEMDGRRRAGAGCRTARAGRISRRGDTGFGAHSADAATRDIGVGRPECNRIVDDPRR